MEDSSRHILTTIIPFDANVWYRNEAQKLLHVPIHLSSATCSFEWGNRFTPSFCLQSELQGLASNSQASGHRAWNDPSLFTNAALEWRFLEAARKCHKLLSILNGAVITWLTAQLSINSYFLSLVWTNVVPPSWLCTLYHLSKLTEQLRKRYFSVPSVILWQCNRFLSISWQIF